MKIYDEIIDEIYHQLPKNTMLLMCTGHGNTYLIQEQFSNMIRIKRGLMEGNWTDEDELNFKIESDRVIQGICMVNIKT